MVQQGCFLWSNNFDVFFFDNSNLYKKLDNYLSSTHAIYKFLIQKVIKWSQKYAGVSTVFLENFSAVVIPLTRFEDISFPFKRIICWFWVIWKGMLMWLPVKQYYTWIWQGMLFSLLPVFCFIFVHYSPQPFSCEWVIFMGTILSLKSSCKDSVVDRIYLLFFPPSGTHI